MPSYTSQVFQHSLLKTVISFLAIKFLILLPILFVFMTSHLSLKNLAVLVLALALCVQGTLGGVSCENLEKDKCAFAVSSSGMRCILEKGVRRSGEETYSCRSSEIDTDNNLNNWIETDQCIQACGLSRNSVGISTDSLLESQFTHKLCSSQCYDNCPNVVDLYFNLAAVEGVLLPMLCKAQEKDGRRSLAEIRSSGIAAPGPMSESMTVAPAMSPF